jgi:MarR family transcriptional regulator, transcriptional regulator for hemolysin
LPQTDRDRTHQYRLKRESLLAALLDVFPTDELHPYAEASERYQRLYYNRREAEIRGMLVARLAILMRRWRKLLEAKLERHDQNVVRSQVLFQLSVNAPGETLTSIATRVGVVGPRLVGILDELERDGLIERTIDEQDRRSKLIALTPAGDETVATVFEMETNLREDFLRGVGMNEMLLMLDAINTMSKNLDHAGADDLAS